MPPGPGGAAPAQDGAAQADMLQALIQALGNLQAPGAANKKVTPLSKTGATEWLTWKKNFRGIVAINNWGRERAIRELTTSLEGKAASAVSGITVDAADAATTLDDVLRRYEERFIPPLASDIARAEFRKARQLPGEDVQDWSNRVRELFDRAHPAMAADAETNLELKDQFVHHLHNSVVRDYVMDRRCETYSAATAAAQLKTANIALFHPGRSINAAAAPSGTGDASASLCAMNAKRPGCVGCKQGPPHQVNACPLGDFYAWYIDKNPHMKEIFMKRFQAKSGSASTGSGARSRGPRQGGAVAKARSGQPTSSQPASTRKSGNKGVNSVAAEGAAAAAPTEGAGEDTDAWPAEN